MQKPGTSWMYEKDSFALITLLVVFLWASLVPCNPNFQVAIMHASFVWTECNAIWSHVFGPSITCNLIMHVFDNLSCENHGVWAKVLTLHCCRWQSVAFSKLLLIINWIFGLPKPQIHCVKPTNCSGLWNKASFNVKIILPTTEFEQSLEFL